MSVPARARGRRDEVCPTAPGRPGTPGWASHWRRSCWPGSRPVTRHSWRRRAKSSSSSPGGQRTRRSRGHPATAPQYLRAVFSELGDNDRAQIARQVLGRTVAPQPVCAGPYGPRVIEHPTVLLTTPAGAAVDIEAEVADLSKSRGRSAARPCGAARTTAKRSSSRGRRRTWRRSAGGTWAGPSCVQDRQGPCSWTQSRAAGRATTCTCG